MIICFSNQKGGVGKTTTALNVGSIIATLGYKVLLIDMDPQGNLTSGLGHYTSADENTLTIYDILINDKSAESVYITTDIKNLFLIPSNIELAGAEIELVSKFSREQILKNTINSIKDQFDYILIDCPPSLGLITINALTAADMVYIPVQCEYYALEGITQLTNTINLVKKGLNKDLEIGGVILTMFDARTKLSSDVVGEVKRVFGQKVFDTVIPRSVRLSEAPSYGKPINMYENASKGAKSYDALAKEIVKRHPAKASKKSKK